jgi:hypothetical protein
MNVFVKSWPDQKYGNAFLGLALTFCEEQERRYRYEVNFS